MIVSAALVDSCCERIDEANDANALSPDLTVPIGQGENSETTSANLGSSATIFRPMARDFASVMSTRQDTKPDGVAPLPTYSLFLAVTEFLQG